MNLAKNRLLQLLDGHSVAIVGNGPVEGDFSQEIDSCDVVVRFNHMYRLDEGKTGKKISIILQTFTSDYMAAWDKHNREVLIQKPEVFLVKQRENCSPWMYSFYGPDVRVNDLIDAFRQWHPFTTGGAALSYLANYANNSTFKIYGFPGGKPWEDYIAGPGHWYKGVAANERKVVEEAKEMLAKKSISRPAKPGVPPIPRMIVVPVKRHSSGKPGKNRTLLFPLLEKLAKTPYPVTVCGDDDELLYSAEMSFDNIRAFHSPAVNIGNTDDVTNLLRYWRDVTRYCGDIALVQCTSPDIACDWIEDSFKLSASSALVATAKMLDFKPNAIYRADAGGRYAPLTNLPPASCARQNLPPCCRITGAVEVFHSDALDFPSFWQCAPLKPYFTPTAEDVD